MALPETHQSSSVVSNLISMEAPPPRLDRVRQWIAANELDALIVTGPALVTWITGYARYYGGPGAVVIGPDGERTLVALRDEVAVAEQLADADRVVGYGERGFGLELNPIPLLASEVHKVSVVSAARRLGVAGDHSGGVMAGRTATIVAADDALHKMSLVKDADELAKIFHAYELCWLAHAEVAEGTRAGASEIEMLSAGQAAAQIHHGSPVDFGADLLAAANTADVCGPIAVAGRTRAAPGQPVIADICVGADGYWADTCRTHLNGANAEVDNILGRLDAILNAAAAQLRTGAAGADVFDGMRGQIKAAWPDGEFPHHGGHGVGLSVFDDPHVIPADSSTVQSWMVMALEPGVYLPGRFGVRKENLFLVTPDGAVELTQAMGRPLDERARSAWSA